MEKLFKQMLQAFVFPVFRHLLIYLLRKRGYWFELRESMCDDKLMRND